MNIEELVKKIGNKAKDIIISDLSLETKGNLVDCPYKDHQKGLCINAQWRSDTYKFYCHDCKRFYSIVDHAKSHGNTWEYLCKLANVEYKKKEIKTVKPFSVKRTDNALAYLNGRGITTDTIRSYGITTDERWIYFNYIVKDDPTHNKGRLVRIKSRAIGDMDNGGQKYGPSPGSAVLWGMHRYTNQKYLVVTEGEIDAMSMHEIYKQTGKEDQFLCVSMPAGAGSFSWIDNCIDFLMKFDMIIFVPDNDEHGGIESLQDAATQLSELNLSWINCIESDVNALLMSPDTNSIDCLKTIQRLVPGLSGARKTIDIDIDHTKNGYMSGYVTHDYNDNGLKDGCVTLLTGRTGDGKTTYTRQILLSFAKQHLKSWMYVGETTVGKEKAKLSRLCVEDKSQIKFHYGTGGRKIYTPTAEACERYDKEFGDKIMISDRNDFNNKSSLFRQIMKEIATMSKYYGVKLFVLDNLMVLCEKSGQALLTEQKEIVQELKHFAENNKVHIILVAHPRKGEGHQEVSGAQEIQNLVDSIVRYVRVLEDFKSAALKGVNISDSVKKRVSAMVLFEKVRDDGARKTAFLEWDDVVGAVYDISELNSAKAYEDDGYWTRYISRYGASDRPAPIERKDISG